MLDNPVQGPAGPHFDLTFEQEDHVQNPPSPSGLGKPPVRSLIVSLLTFSQPPSPHLPWILARNSPPPLVMTSSGTHTKV